MTHLLAFLSDSKLAITFLHDVLGQLFDVKLLLSELEFSKETGLRLTLFCSKRIRSMCCYFYQYPPSNTDKEQNR